LPHLQKALRGTIHRIDRVQDGNQIQPGEILVTTITDVGCGNATMLLKTGDRVRVDGGHGVVEIL